MPLAYNICGGNRGTKAVHKVHKGAERLLLLPRQRQRNPARPGRAFTVAFHGCVATPASMASAGESPGGGGFKHGVACAGAAVFTKLRHRRCLFAHGVEAGASFASVSRRRGATRDRHRKLSPPATPVQQRPCSYRWIWRRCGEQERRRRRTRNDCLPQHPPLIPGSAVGARGHACAGRASRWRSTKRGAIRAGACGECAEFC